MTKLFQHAEICCKENNTLLVPSEITLFAAKVMRVKALGKDLSCMQEQGNPGQAVLVSPLHWGLDQNKLLRQRPRSSDSLLLETQPRLCLWGCDHTQVPHFGNCLHSHLDSQSNGSDEPWPEVRRELACRSQSPVLQSW